MAELISGPLTDNASQAATPFDSTTGEVLGATATDAFDSLPAVGILRGQQRFNESGQDPDAASYWGNYTDARNAGSDVDAMAAERGDAPVRNMIQPDDANAQAKQAGAQGLTFDKPIADTAATSIIQDHVAAQQRADIIARRADSILTGGVARFGVGALVSLADPLNDVAMMIPAAPEAFVAAKLAGAAGAFERTAIRAAAGAANGAVGMAALEPLQYGLAKQDYNDWSAGQALRDIAFGAVLGGAGHAILGGLFGHVDPQTREAALRASVGQTLAGKPVDVAGLTDFASLNAEADYLERHAVSPTAAPDGLIAYHGTPHEVDAFDTSKIGTGEGAQAFGHGLYFAEDKGLADWYRRVLSQGEMTPALEETLTQLHETLKARTADMEMLRQQGIAIGTPGADAVLGPHNERIAELNKQLADHGEAKTGNLYQVVINSERQSLLDWDKPLDEQPPQVQNGLAQLGLTGADAAQGADLGASVAPKTAEGAAAFKQAGINGVQYLDAKSRRAGEGTRNLVVFNDQDVQITHRNGVPVQQAIADLRARATQAAKDMAARAKEPTVDPVTQQAERSNKALVDTAPKVDPAMDKQLAEATQLANDALKALQAHLDMVEPAGASRIADHPAGPIAKDAAPPSSGRYAAFVDGRWIAGDVKVGGGKFGPEEIITTADGKKYTARWDGMVELKSGEAAPTTPPPWASPSKPAEGMVRVYHGGSDPTGDTGTRFVSDDRKYAQGYANKSERGVVSYADLHESDPRLVKVFDDAGSDVKSPYSHFEIGANELRPEATGLRDEMKAANDAADMIEGDGKAAQAAASCLISKGF